MARLPRAGGRAVLGAALVLAAAAVVSGHDFAQVTLALAAAVLGVAALWIGVSARRRARAADAAVRAVAETVARDPQPTLLTAANRVIVHANPAARAELDAEGETTLAGALGGVLANAAPVLAHLQSEADARGAARRDITTGDGRLTLRVHKVGQVGGAGHYLWRVALLPEGPAEGGATGLATLTLAEDDSVLAASAAACELLGAQPERADEISLRPPLRMQCVNEIRTSSGIVSCLVAEVPQGEDRREVVLLPGVEPGAETADGWGFFDALPVPLLKLARDGTIEQSNPPARRLLGIESGEGRRLGDLIEGPGRPVGEWLDDAASGRGTVQPETVRLRRQDREAFVQVSLNPAADAGRTVLIAVLTDATRLKSLEAQFVQSQKMQAIGQLAGGVAHDFNNLLTAISGHCDLLLLRHDADETDYADLMQISQNANRAAALVGQLLAFSRKQTLRPEIMDMREMLSDVIHLLNRLVGETVSIAVSNVSDLWAVRADRRQLEQVLMNLVVNARDAMAPDGGEIVISTENLHLDAALRRDRAVVAPGRYVVVRVSDSGVGIPPDRRDKIFEPFFTTKRAGEGTGLGLSTVYGIVKQTGGFIFVDSTPGVGSEFILMLPAHEAKSAPAPPRDSPAVTARAGGVVLLVEDEAPVRAFASRALKMRGVSVLEAETVEQSLGLLEDETLRVDVFVTDVVMPGMDGPEG